MSLTAHLVSTGSEQAEKPSSRKSRNVEVRGVLAMRQIQVRRPIRRVVGYELDLRTPSGRTLAF
jgi:hypothetical protein